MPIIVHESKPRYLPTGMHSVTVKNIEETEDLNDPQRTKLMVELEAIEEIDGGHPTARFWTSPVLHPKGRLKPFAEAVLGRPLTDVERREGFDVTDLIGKTVCVVVKEAVSKAGKTFAKVVDFFPVKAD